MNTTKFKLPVLFILIGLFLSACNPEVGLDNLVDNDDTDEVTLSPSQALAEDIDHQLISQWTSLLMELERYALGMRPNASARALAYIHLATYETVLPGMPNYLSMEDNLRGLRIRNDQQPEELDLQIALNAAYADVLDHFLLNVTGNRKSQIARLEAQLEEALSDGVSEEVIADSKFWGTYVAEQVIEYSQSDREAEEQIQNPQPTSYEPPTGAGFWTYSAEPERALFPYWGEVRTFVISSRQTSTVEPIAYSEAPNSEYFAQMREVYDENNQAREDDDEQLWIAEFWSDDVEEIMMSPPARQVAIAQQLIEQYGLNLEESLAMMLKLGFALNDAAVSTWADKYEYMVMRPNVFIHEFIDPDFQTNLFRLVYWPNPSFPGYPSGHSCFASAATGVFIGTFGNTTNFTDRTHQGREEFRGAPRTFTTFTEMADENGYSRIPLGVHIRMDCTEGLRLGYEISDAVNDLDLKRIL